MTRVAIIGSGFGGLGAAVRLKQDGLLDEGGELVVFERSTDVGGVWRDNRYPGAACDVPSHLYSFSFAPKADWTRRYAQQGEIHDYLRGVARDFDVLRHVRFATEVLSATWDEPEAVWRLALSDGSTHVADVVIAACGQLSRPARPDVPGLEGFAGPLFHSAEWPDRLDLAGKRVGVIGTGASAIQFVPEVARQAASTVVFQRSAPYVIPKRDWVWPAPVRRALERRPGVLKGSRWLTYWTNETRSLGFNTAPRLLAGHEQAFRRQLVRQVPDPALRRKLTPDHRIGCKRILISNDWYAALTRSDVEVVDDRIDRVTATSVVTADGRAHEVDVVVLGTGFATTQLLAPMAVTGRGGVALTDVWRDGPQAHLGTTVSGFPNLFLLYGPNTNLGHNSIVLMLEAQIGYLLQAVRHLRSGQARSLDVRPEVMRSYNAWVQRRSAKTVFGTGCTSWYLTKDGRNTQNWPGSTIDFRRRLRRFRLADHVVVPAVPAQPARAPQRVTA